MTPYCHTTIGSLFYDCNFIGVAIVYVVEEATKMVDDSNVKYGMEMDDSMKYVRGE